MLSEVPKVIPEQIKYDSKDDSAVDNFPEDDIDSLGVSESSLRDSSEIAKSDAVSNEAASTRVMDFAGNNSQFLAIHTHLEIIFFMKQTGKTG